MHKMSGRGSLVIDSNEFPKLKDDSEHKDIKDHQPGNLGHSTTFLSRDDSVNSRGSIASLFLKKSIDGSWSSGSVAGIYTPRVDKSRVLFDILLATLNEMYENYSKKTTCSEDPAVEDQDYTEMLFKIDDRISMIDSFKIGYLALANQRQEELNKIDANIRSYLNNKHNKQILEIDDSEAYWSVCRELFVTESKLERCTGKLQFQIMELDFIGKINPLDQYELSIRLNETSKFKTKIKIDKAGHQVWESRNFVLIPGIDDFLYVKFSELKPLNKSVVIIDKKVPFINNLIRPEPSIFMFWLSPVGSIKLKAIVQWNPVLIDPGIQSYLMGLDSKFLEGSFKADSSSGVSQRPVSLSHKYTNNRMSSNIESLFRSGNIEKNSRCSSMSNILEEDDKAPIHSKLIKTSAQSAKESSLVKSSTSDAIAGDRSGIDTSTPLHTEPVPCVVISDAEPEQVVPECTTLVESEPVILRKERIDVVLVMDTESAAPDNEDSCLSDDGIEKTLTGDCLDIESPVVGDSDGGVIVVAVSEDPQEPTPIESLSVPPLPRQHGEKEQEMIESDGEHGETTTATPAGDFDSSAGCLGTDVEPHRSDQDHDRVCQDADPSLRDKHKSVPCEDRQRLLAEIRAVVFSLDHCKDQESEVHDKQDLQQDLNQDRDQNQQLEQDLVQRLGEDQHREHDQHLGQEQLVDRDSGDAGVSAEVPEGAGQTVQPDSPVIDAGPEDGPPTLTFRQSADPVTNGDGSGTDEVLAPCDLAAVSDLPTPPAEDPRLSK